MRNETLLNTKVGRIVADDFRTAAVFSMYGIDFCCKGGTTLQDACDYHQVEPALVIEQIQKLQEEPRPYGYADLTMEELIHHVQDVHHTYVRNTVPLLQAYLDKLCRVHGERHPELFSINKEFSLMAGDLFSHMQKEEQILFPYLLAMYRAHADNFELSPPHFGHVDNPITVMEDEHDRAGEHLWAISKYSNDYTAPADGCQTYRVAYAMLKEFESDMHTHIHLENNLIFPAGREMYNQLVKTKASGTASNFSTPDNAAEPQHNIEDEMPNACCFIPGKNNV